MMKKIIFILFLTLIPIQSARATIYLDVWTDEYVYYPGEPIIVYIYGTGFPSHLTFPTSCQVDYIMDGIYDSYTGYCLMVLTHVDLPHTWTIQHNLSDYAPGPGFHSIWPYMHGPYGFFCHSEYGDIFVTEYGDINKDGYVDFIDYSILAQAWKATPSDENWNASCNLAPPDDIIDFSDLKVITDNWLAGF
ncbi:MAG: hypothetical protein ACYS91_02400 [Planctomycetota bacterium]